MGNFTDLAPELISEILSYLEFEPATLCQLALASTRFRDPAQQTLLKHLVLQLDCSEGGGTSPFDHVVSILDRDPRLPDLVRTLIVSWTAPSIQIQPRFFAFLGRLQGLECLHISTMRMLDRIPELPSEAHDLLMNALARLKRFRRSRGLISWRALDEFTNLPSLVDISLEYPPPRFPRPGSEDGGFASLRRLELGNWKGPRQNDPLEALLEKTTSLEALHVSIHEETHTQILAQLSEIGQVFSAVRHTLKDLTIDGPPRYERSILDLTGFTSLERVRAVADFFYCPRRADRLRDGMHWRLPKTLKEFKVAIPFNLHFQVLTILELVFMSRCGFVLRTVDPWMPGMTVLNPKLEEQWVAQLAINKAIHFPELQSVSITENVWDKGSKAEDFKFPNNLPLAFQANSVAFQARCCVVQRDFIHRFEVLQ